MLFGLHPERHSQEVSGWTPYLPSLNLFLSTFLSENTICISSRTACVPISTSDFFKLMLVRLDLLKNFFLHCPGFSLTLNAHTSAFTEGHFSVTIFRLCSDNTFFFII